MTSTDKPRICRHALGRGGNAPYRPSWVQCRHPSLRGDTFSIHCQNLYGKRCGGLKVEYEPLSDAELEWRLEALVTNFTVPFLVIVVAAVLIVILVWLGWI